MGKSAWYQVDTSRVYAASPAPPKEPVPDGDEWLDDYKPKDWQQQNDELDEQMRTIDVGDGLAQWDLDDEALNAVELRERPIGGRRRLDSSGGVRR